MNYCRVNVWRLSRPLHDINMLLLEPLLRCFDCMLHIIVMLGDPKMAHLQSSGGGKDVDTQDCTLHVSLHPFVDDVKLSCALARQTPSNHNGTTFMHDGEDGVLGIIGSSSLSQNTLNCVHAKQLDFGFI